MITTVKGKVKRLGKTYIHEHIKLDLSGHKKILIRIITIQMR